MRGEKSEKFELKFIFCWELRRCVSVMWLVRFTASINSNSQLQILDLFLSKRSRGWWELWAKFSILFNQSVIHLPQPPPTLQFKQQTLKFQFLQHFQDKMLEYYLTGDLTPLLLKHPLGISSDVEGGREEAEKCWPLSLSLSLSLSLPSLKINYKTKQTSLLFTLLTHQPSTNQLHFRLFNISSQSQSWSYFKKLLVKPPGVFRSWV